MSLKIFTRAQWAAAPASSSFASFEAFGIVIHNMQNNNRAPASTEAEELRIAFEKSRDCQHSHMHGREPKFSDIGQQFTLSRGGIVMEGRTGSLAEAQKGKVVRGAHASGVTHFNKHYFGIEIEGDNRASDQVTAQQWSALVELCAQLTLWSGKPALHIIHHGEVVEGHTDCPGKFKDRMDKLRDAVAKMVSAGGSAPKGAKGKKLAKGKGKSAAKSFGAKGAHDFPFVTTDWAPPVNTQVFLNNIDWKHAQPLNWGSGLKGLIFMGTLPGGAMIMQTDMDTDADGSPNFKKLDPKHGQAGTALGYSGIKGSALDAEKVPYFVLPGTKDAQGKLVFRQLGFEKGDLAAVMWNGRLAFAVFGDVGPSDKIGEGSIRLVEQLGFDPFNTKHEVVRGISDNKVITVVFKGSRIPGLKPGTAEADIRAKAAQLFAALGGLVDVGSKAAPKSLAKGKAKAKAAPSGLESVAEAPDWSPDNDAHRLACHFMVAFFLRGTVRDQLLAVPKSERFAAAGTLPMAQFSHNTSAGTPGAISTGNAFTAAASLVESAEKEWNVRWNNGLRSHEAAQALAAVLADGDKTVIDLGHTLDDISTFA